jgi:glucose/arabinose dehydrogenase
MALLIVVLTGFVNLESPQQVTATSSVQVVYQNLNFPVSFKFAHDGRIFFNEKDTGNVRVIASNGTVLSKPFATLPITPTSQGTEQGLLGLALDPLFDSNSLLYVYYTYTPQGSSFKHVAITRCTTVGNLGTNPTTMFDLIDPNPNFTNHNGGYMRFGPDGKLYVVVGEFAQPSLSQDMTSYAGKILRMNPDGSAPSDNPITGSLIYASGIRNGFGMDFSPTGKLVATIAGPNCCDTILIVLLGANYGWPICGTDQNPNHCQSPPYTNAIFQWGRQPSRRQELPTQTPQSPTLVSKEQAAFVAFDSTPQERE